MQPFDTNSNLFINYIINTKQYCRFRGILPVTWHITFSRTSIYLYLRFFGHFPIILHHQNSPFLKITDSINLGIHKHNHFHANSFTRSNFFSSSANWCYCLSSLSSFSYCYLLHLCRYSFHPL